MHKLKRFSPVLMVIVLVGALTWMSWATLHDPDPKPTDAGLVSAAGPPLQYQPCVNVPAGAFVLNLGNAALWFRDLPHTVVTVGDQPALVLSRNASGTLGVDMTITEGNTRLGQLKGAALTADSTGLRLTRPRASSLTVSTANGTPLVQIDYINDRNLRITGHVTFGQQDFLMKSDSFLIGSRNVGNTCVGGDKKVDFRL